MKGRRAGRDASSPFLVISLSGGFRETNRICFSRRMEDHDGDSGCCTKDFCVVVLLQRIFRIRGRGGSSGFRACLGSERMKIYQSRYERL